AAASTFDGPARAALLPTLVPREMFPRAVTIASTNQALAFATGPALGGLLIAAAGVSAVYAAYAVLTSGSLTPLAFLPPTRAPRRLAHRPRLRARHPARRPARRAVAARDPRRAVLRPQATGGARLHGARHVRRDLRGRSRAAPDLRAGDPARQASRLRAAQL